MYKKIAFFVLAGLLSLLVISCDMIQSMPVFHNAVNELNQLQTEMKRVFDIFGKAVVTVGREIDDTQLLSEFEGALRAFDDAYGSNVMEVYDQVKERVNQEVFTDLPPLTDIPMTTDGAIYLSGGVSNATSIIINFLNPKTSTGAYSHGAVLDLEKYSGNPDVSCFLTTDIDGAGYETLADWQSRPNVAVMEVTGGVDEAALDDAQAVIDEYCSKTLSSSYGFFENAVDFTSPVSKEDNEWFYCTKVVWRIYDEMGIDIDSNTDTINWKNSGLYSLVEGYYRILYWDAATANQKIDEYINEVGQTLVLAEEIYASDLLTKVYENIRIEY